MASLHALHSICTPASVSSPHLSCFRTSAAATASPSLARSSSSGPLASLSRGNGSKSFLETAASGLTALGLAAALQFSPAAVSSALADEFNVLRSEPPVESHYFDEAGVLSRVTHSDLKRLLTQLEEETGFHIDVVTLRKIASKGDVFELADKVLETWYPTVELGNNRGVVLLVTSAKEGAIAGGPAFLEKIGDDLLEAVITENLPVLATEEKYNEAIYSSAKRLFLKLEGQPDIPGPKFEDNKRESNYKTRQETEDKRTQFTFVVGGLLVIAFVVPMLQYWAYVAPRK